MDKHAQFNRAARSPMLDAKLLTQQNFNTLTQNCHFTIQQGQMWEAMKRRPRQRERAKRLEEEKGRTGSPQGQKRKAPAKHK